MTQPRLALAHRLMDGGSLSAAEAAIADILAADPGDIEANVLRAELSLRRGDTETARDGFRKVSRTAGLSDRTAAVAHAGLGTACHGLGEAEDATCQRRSKSTPLAGVKMHHLMRFSPALAVVPVVHRRDPRCFV